MEKYTTIILIIFLIQCNNGSKSGECVFNSECASGNECTNGQCIDPNFENLSDCESNLDCSGNQECSNGKCLSPGNDLENNNIECENNDDCEINEECTNARCRNKNSQFTYFLELVTDDCDELFNVRIDNIENTCNGRINYTSFDNSVENISVSDTKIAIAKPLLISACSAGVSVMNDLGCETEIVDAVNCINSYHSSNPCEFQDPQLSIQFEDIACHAEINRANYCYERNCDSSCRRRSDSIQNLFDQLAPLID